ncbi:MAG: mandelate racemase/muconate lactonizing enzyme family protein [bacterium]
MALWDIKGKALGVPVYQLIGGLARQKVLTYNHLHGETKEALLEHAQASVAEGWRCLRFEPPYDPNHVWNAARSISESIERWQLLRENLGDEVELCFDAHTRFNLAEAAQFCRAVEPLRPLFIEDALRSELNQSYHGLRQQTSVPLAAGEQFGTKWDFKYLVENELINMARIDLCIAGGLTESLKIAHLCEAHGVDIAVHNPLGPVSTAVCLHLNLAISNMAVQELPRRPGECMADAVESHIEWQDGYLLPPSVPGLGVTLNVEALANYPFTPEELPRLHRGDGSFQNW